MTHRILAFALAGTLISLTACGGGGGGHDDGAGPIPGVIAPSGTSSAQPVPSVSSPAPAGNRAPVAEPSVVQLLDWEAHEGVLPGEDPDGDSIRFQLVSGPSGFQFIDRDTGAYRYRPINQTKTEILEYQISDEYGAYHTAQVTFLHATKPVVASGECPVASLGFVEPVAGVWTHPDDAILFVGFGEDRMLNVRRYELVDFSNPVLGPALEETGNAPVLGAVDELIVDPDDPEVIYARGDLGDVLISRDAGRTFNYLELGSVVGAITDIEVTGGPHGYLWAVTERGIYRAAKNTLVFEAVRATSANLYSDFRIVVHADRPERILVSAADGVHRSDDSGATWRQLIDAPSPWLIGDAHDPERIYGNGQTSVYVSNDFGETWEHAGFFGFMTDLMEADPFRPGRLYISPWDYTTGMYESDDAGQDFRRVEDLPELVKGLAFTSTGAMYVSQGNRIVCRPYFEPANYDPGHPLGVELTIEGAADSVIAEIPVQGAVNARVNVVNRVGMPVRDVRMEAWIEGPAGRVGVFSELVEVSADGWEIDLPLPAPTVPGRYKVIVNADPADRAAAGASSWFVASQTPPVAGPYVESAELETNTLWLNAPNPWLPVVTNPGEQRRMVLDVDNNGPDTARNVVVRIATGSLLRVDRYGPVYSGQTMDCSQDAAALTCVLGDIPDGDTFYIELYVTPLVTLTAVPVYLTADTPQTSPNVGGLDLVAAITGPDSFQAGTILTYTVTVTNTGDETAESNRVHGAIGPWPAVTLGHRVDLDPACSAEDTSARDDEPFTYICSFWFLGPGESVSYRFQIAAPESGHLTHVAEAVGFPRSGSAYWTENFRGNNSRGLITLSAP
jgi:photosystem II stability/assembly factor-like uncharacterized protein